MTDAVKKFLTDIIYIAYKNKSFDILIKNIYITFSQYMPISKITLYKFDTYTCKKISQYAYNENIFKSPDVVKIDKDIFERLLVETQGIGNIFRPRIYKNDANTACGQVFTMLHAHEGTSLYVPLILEIDPYVVTFLSIFSSSKDCYTGEHINLFEEMYDLFNMIVNNIFLSQKNGEEEYFKIEKSNNNNNIYTNIASLHDTPASFVPFDQYISEYIKKAIRHTNGRISGKNGAASLLGLHATTLWSKMRKLGIKSVKIPYEE